METTVAIPDALRDKVKAVGSAVTRQELDAYGRFREIEDRSYKLQRILEAWEGQHREERAMRKTYAAWMLIGLGVQMLLVNAAFFLIGFKMIEVNQWVANTFIMAVFGEIAGMTF